MYPDIWSACRETAAPGPLKGTLLRLVESQEQVATNRLVDSLEEQAALEAMLEATKPPCPPKDRATTCSSPRSATRPCATAPGSAAASSQASSTAR